MHSTLHIKDSRHGQLKVYSKVFNWGDALMQWISSEERGTSCRSLGGLVDSSYTCFLLEVEETKVMSDQDICQSNIIFTN